VPPPGVRPAGSIAKVSPEMKPKILLTGKNGQVGHELSRMLPQIGDLIAVDRSSLDLSDPAQIRDVAHATRPTIIVNAAAYTAVDKAESEETLARAINGRAPAILAEEARKIGAALVHYSTDYVFDGTKNSPYVEEDAPNPQSVYGKTKLEGERAIRDSGVAHLIFRTAWVYAREGRNFLLTILKLATQREELRIVRDQIGAPTAAREIAVATTQILKQLTGNADRTASFANVRGTYHMTAAGETSWFQFAEAILEEARAVSPDSAWYRAATGGLPIITRRIIPITSAEYPTPARRPAYSVLSNERLTRAFHAQLLDWREQLRATFRQPA